jgi:hypothetical protein
MFGVLFDFVLGFIIGRNARNSAQTARNTAALVEMASLTEAQKIERAKRAEFLRGERRFVYAVFAVLMGLLWAVGALTGSGHP